MLYLPYQIPSDTPLCIHIGGDLKGGMGNNAHKFNKKIIQMKTIQKLTLLFCLSILVTSCCACRQGSPKIGDLENAKWKLIELNGNEVVNYEIVLTFDAAEKMIYGQCPCNNFFAGYSLINEDENNIKIMNPGATRKYCPDSKIEDEFAAKIGTITTVKLEGNDTIMLLNEAGELVAVLDKQHVAQN